MDMQEIYRRAGGRRKYNAARRKIADRRLIPLTRQLAVMGELEAAIGLEPRKRLPRHFAAAMAKALGVHRSTVWRDIERLRTRKIRWNWKYSGDTGMAVIRLRGLTKFAYKL